MLGALDSCKKRVQTVQSSVRIPDLAGYIILSVMDGDPYFQQIIDQNEVESLSQLWCKFLAMSSSLIEFSVETIRPNHTRSRRSVSNMKNNKVDFR